VIIQTYNPEHYAIQFAGKQDFEGFAKAEIAFRKRLFYPPHYRLARILFQRNDLQELCKEMNRLQKNALPTQTESLMVLGPSPAPFSKINQLYRYHVILKGKTPHDIKEAIANIIEGFKTKLHHQIDIDPMMLM
ncbi:MAG: primosomal protein N', partial [Candidatus Cloacimonetes bacterium]|nr:primosomal protein N' [Candidatus Cloacimonadota bacterium]